MSDLFDYPRKFIIIAILFCFNIAIAQDTIVSNTLKEAICLSDSGNYSAAIKKALDALYRDSINKGGNHPYVIMDDYYLSVLYRKQKDYDKTIQHGKQALEKHKRYYLDSDKRGRLTILGILFQSYLEKKNYIEAINIGKETAEILSTTENEEYAKTLNNLAYCYNKVGDYGKACFYSEHCLSIREKVLGKSSSLYVQTLQNLYHYYYNASNYQKAIEVAQEEFKLDSIYLGNSSERLGSLFHNIATCFIRLEDYKQTEFYGLKALTFKQTYFPTNVHSIINTLSVLSSCYNFMSNWEKAIYYTSMSIELQNNIDDANPRIFSEQLNNMANYYSYLGQYERAIEYGNHAVDSETKLGISSNLVKSLNNLSLYYSYTEDYKSATAILEKAKDIGVKIWGENGEEMATIYGNLSLCYLDLGMNAVALDYGKKALAINKDSSSHAINQVQFANILISQNKILDAVSYLEKAVITFRDCKETNVSLNYYLTLYTLGQCYYEMGKQNSAYNCFKETLSLSSWINNNLIQLNVKEREDFYDRWGQIISQLPQYLLDDSSNKMKSIAYDAIIAYKGILLSPLPHISNWQDVRNALNQDEAAIEFIRLFSSNNDEKYGALVITPQNDSPYYVSLPNASVIQKIIDEINIDDINNLIWKQLEPYLVNAQTIYMSSMGLMNICPIENATEKFIVKRVSSTARLIKNKDEKSLFAKYALIGGIRYERLTGGTTSEEASMASLNDISAGTQIEISTISDYLNSCNIPFVLHSGLVNKNILNCLSNDSIKNLHIATHGYYWNHDIFKKKRDICLKITSNIRKPSYEEIVLHRCGLLFTGAQETLAGKPDGDTEHNGILTGFEISQLNLSTIDMVVLSACQTGLGDNTFDEGCFGLQRAFKRAGVRSLLMSLWKVNSISSRLLLTEFYKNCLEGTGKHESLRIAQKYVREYKDSEGNYLFEKPYYWAGFIMLD